MKDLIKHECGMLRYLGWPYFRRPFAIANRLGNEVAIFATYDVDICVRVVPTLRPGMLWQERYKIMAHNRIKLIGSGHYHIYSRFVLGKFLLSERKEIRTHICGTL